MIKQTRSATKMASLGLKRQLELVRALNALLEMKHTGTLEEIALGLSVSEELAIDLIVTMIETMGCPISYDSSAKTYYYTSPGKLNTFFTR